jgi:hypothetical protein
LATQRPFELSQPRAASPNKAEEIVSPRFTARDIPAEVLKASDPEFAKKQERERQERIKARAAQVIKHISFLLIYEMNNSYR